MSTLATTGDIAGLALLGAAVAMTAARLFSRDPAAGPRASRSDAAAAQVPRHRHAGASPTAHSPAAPALDVPAAPAHVYPAPGPMVPAQTPWQSRLLTLPRSVEDRVPGSAALQLEEAVGSRDQ